ncbi:LLM class flavin-dependent oxidoreductase [Cellulosimicrobium terreum]|nr:LLM class flavin-dependent oxidoreductase [Cellulosimicrobium terreum]
MSEPRSPSTVHLGVDLSDAGARPAAWRAVGSQARRLFDAGRLADLVATAQRGVLDLVVLDDAFALRPGQGGGTRGGLDAVLVASRLAQASTGIGLVPTVSATAVDPSHVATALATIDQVSAGRAGWQVGWTATAAEADLDGPDRTIEAVVRSWDDREEAAGVRAVGLGTVADPGVLRHVDHEGVRFAVRGPSPTPRSPQVRPPVVVRVDSAAALGLAARRADVVRVRAATLDEAVRVRSRVRDAAARAGRDPDRIRVLVDAYVVVGDTRASAQARLDLLEDLEGVSWDTGSLTHVGTARDLAVTVEEWALAGAADGFLLRPSSLGTDLDAVVDGVVPALQGAGLFRTAYPGTTLRETLGLPHPARRCAAVA